MEASPIAQELPVHGFDGGIGGLEALVGHKAEAARGPRLRVPHDFWGVDDHAEGAEGVVQQLHLTQHSHWRLPAISVPLCQASMLCFRACWEHCSR